ncbi:MAG: 2-oxo-tetronate isomerase [Alphaproteobacteria bacterium]
MPNFDANISWLFTELPFLDRFEAAAKAGFRAVEIQNPYEHPKDAIVARLERHTLQVALHNMPAGDWAAGERGLACLPDRVADFRATSELALDYAVALRAPRVHCMAGIAPANADPRILRDTYVGNLRELAAKAARAKVDVMIEPINTRDIPGYYLNRSAQAVSLLDEIGAPNVRLQYDVYHMQIMEGDLAPTIERLLPRIGHVQIADTPGRHEPGTGEINYPFVLGKLDALGYAGWVGCEYRPRAGTVEGLGWMAPWRDGAR